MNPRRLGKACSQCGGWRKRRTVYFAFAYCSHKRMGFLWPYRSGALVTYQNVTRKQFAALLTQILATAESLPHGAEGMK